MSYWIEKGIQELEEWEQRTFIFLSERGLSHDDITNYLDEYQRDSRELYAKTKNEGFSLTPSFYSAIASISQIRFLLEKIKQPLAENIPADIAAYLAVLSFRAGYQTGGIMPARGMELFEPHAKSQLARRNNQPPTRSRNNIEKDDVMYRLDEYHTKKGKPPECLEHFLTFLSNARYEIDHVNRTVMSPTAADITWPKRRSFGTIANNIREYRKITSS